MAADRNRHAIVPHQTVGTALIAKGAGPRSRAVVPWEQQVTDSEGRRRFHGAFTGGFSAGYYNTVGSAAPS